MRVITKNEGDVIVENDGLDLSPLFCSSSGQWIRPSFLDEGLTGSAVCRLQSALGLRPRSALSSAGAKGVLRVA